MIKVSKTGFMNLIRCRRFAGLEAIYKDKMDALVSFSNDIEELQSSENALKKARYLENMFGEDDEDLIIPKDIEFELMLPYFNKIEELSARAIKAQFEGTLTYSQDTFKQKRFYMNHSGYQFYCFLDGYLEGEVNRVFESKATTTSKFLRLEYKKESIFAKNIDGIYQLKSELGYLEYLEKEKPLYDKYSDVGVYVYDLAFQRYVIENSKDYDPNKEYKYYLAVLNHEYIFDGSYDGQGEPIYSNDIINFIDFTQTTQNLMPQILEDMNQVVHHIDLTNAGEVDLGKHCQRKKTRQCMFYPVCFDKLPQENSILTYLHNHHGFTDEAGNKHLPYDLINNDKKYDLLDIPELWLTRPNNIIQRRAVESGEAYFNKGKIKAGIDQLKYPIYHLDFESFPCPLPRFKHEGPYNQSLFQFSVHIEHENQVVDEVKDNYYYLAPDLEDRREELVVKLLEVIKPDGGSVMVYNQVFERSRIRELGDMFPKYRDRLNDIANRLFDLMDIVKTNTKFYTNIGYKEQEAKELNYYVSSLNGSYSIKKVLPALTQSKLSYKELPIQDGTQAYVTYAKYNPKDVLKHQQDQEGLIMYCRRDTYSMSLILEVLRQKVHND